MCFHMCGELSHLIIIFYIRFININVTQVLHFIFNVKSSAALFKIILILFENKLGVIIVHASEHYPHFGCDSIPHVPACLVVNPNSIEDMSSLHLKLFHSSLKTSTEKHLIENLTKNEYFDLKAETGCSIHPTLR